MQLLTTTALHASSDTRWSLISQTGEDVLPLPHLPCRVGRQVGLPVRIVHVTVSVVHAELRAHEAGLCVSDLGSRNGTFVNGKRIKEPAVVKSGDLIQFGATVFRLQNQSHADLAVTCHDEHAADLALALAQFEKLMSQPLVVPVYQPIVAAETGQLVAYEALARSSLFGLDKPVLMFRAAEYFRQEAELSRHLRRAELAASAALDSPHLFLNTHPAELADFKQLLISIREIRQIHPHQAVTLEVHEGAVADLMTMKMLRLALDDLNMTLAYDDFGAGQARLEELVEARPEYVKFDRGLISGIDRAERSRRKLVQSLVSMCQQLGIQTLAEGVETAAEAAACRKLGFDLMQGFYFGRPDVPLAGQTGMTVPVNR